MNSGEKNLQKLIQGMKPFLNKGAYVFVSMNTIDHLPKDAIVLDFKEPEGRTLILEKQIADKFQLPYGFVAAWITLKIHSNLEAVGLTAAFSTALADASISCNVVAGFYHDHIFVNINDKDNAMKTLNGLNELN